MPTRVAALMPNTTAVPSTRRAEAPAPLAVASGSEPKMKANEVIRMGRSRRRAPAIAASINGVPRSYSSLANSTMRIAFFAARPISMTSPICA